MAGPQPRGVGHKRRCCGVEGHHLLRADAKFSRDGLEGLACVEAVGVGEKDGGARNNSIGADDGAIDDVAFKM